LADCRVFELKRQRSDWNIKAGKDDLEEYVQGYHGEFPLLVGAWDGAVLLFGKSLKGEPIEWFKREVAFSGQERVLSTTCNAAFLEAAHFVAHDVCVNIPDATARVPPHLATSIEQWSD
jgi:hypothetical protein